MEVEIILGEAVASVGTHEWGGVAGSDEHVEGVEHAVGVAVWRHLY